MPIVHLTSKSHMMAGLVLVVVGLALVSCASKPVLEKDDVKLTRDEPSSRCQLIGPLEGRVLTATGTQEQALENLKEEAVKRGANFVKIESLGAQGTSVRGQAYNCL
ncbi:MAG: hypothetical protein ACK5Y2_08335 [Bdellovibrionales bacterium]